MTSPEQIIQEVLSLMRVAEAKGLTLVAEFVTAIPKSIRSDPTRLRQILMNLVGNAIKFTEVGGVTMRITRTRELAEAAGRSRRYGHRFNGFASRTALQLLEQADASTTRRFGGSGLDYASAAALP
ncbi:MAG: hypothetical protein U0892_09745 [Pirellulales bacterium]